MWRCYRWCQRIIYMFVAIEEVGKMKDVLMSGREIRLLIETAEI